MPNEKKEMVIFLRDNGMSLQFPDGQCAGYGADGNIQVFSGIDRSIYPRKIILHDQRSMNITPKLIDNES